MLHIARLADELLEEVRQEEQTRDLIGSKLGGSVYRTVELDLVEYDQLSAIINAKGYFTAPTQDGIEVIW